MMGEHLFEFDGEAELIEAFESFDEGDTGFVKGEEMKRWLSEVGERMDPEEVRTDQILGSSVSATHHESNMRPLTTINLLIPLQFFWVLACRPIDRPFLEGTFH